MTNLEKKVLQGWIIEYHLNGLSYLWSAYFPGLVNTVLMNKPGLTREEAEEASKAACELYFNVGIACVV